LGYNIGDQDRSITLGDQDRSIIGFQLKATHMSTLSSDLDRVISRLDSETAALLEQTIRDALALAQRRPKYVGPTDAQGYPIGYFESTAGSFSDEPLEAPPELKIDSRESW
jgi:hypothetical protein